MALDHAVVGKHACSLHVVEVTPGAQQEALLQFNLRVARDGVAASSSASVADATVTVCESVRPHVAMDCRSAGIVRCSVAHVCPLCLVALHGNFSSSRRSLVPTCALCRASRGAATSPTSRCASCTASWCVGAGARLRVGTCASLMCMTRCTHNTPMANVCGPSGGRQASQAGHGCCSGTCDVMKNAVISHRP